MPNPNQLSSATNDQVYRRDLTNMQVQLVSSSDGTYAGAPGYVSSMPAMSPNGRFIVYTAWLPGLSADQVFLKDMDTGTLTLASSADGTAANADPAGSKMSATVSADGRTVCYSANVNSLSAHAKCKFFGQGLTPNLSGPLTQVVASGAGASADQCLFLSADASKLVFCKKDPVLGQIILRMDLANPSAPPIQVSGSNAEFNTVQVSDDANRIVWVEAVWSRGGGAADSQGMIRELDLPNSAPRIVTLNAQGQPANGGRSGINRIGISRNGRFVVASTSKTFNSTNNLILGVIGARDMQDGQVYRWDLQNPGTVPVLCSARDSSNPAASYNPYGAYGYGDFQNDGPRISNDGTLCQFVSVQDVDPTTISVWGAGSNTQLVNNSNSFSAGAWSVFVKKLAPSAP